MANCCLNKSGKFMEFNEEEIKKIENEMIMLGLARRTNDIQLFQKLDSALSPIIEFAEQNNFFKKEKIVENTPIIEENKVVEVVDKVAEVENEIVKDGRHINEIISDIENIFTKEKFWVRLKNILKNIF
jgi:hypothetical protein